VGEAPGEKEDHEGLPFVGPSGWLLDKMLSEVGFAKSEIWFTNPYKTRPPNNDIKRLHELGVPLNLFHEQFIEEMRNFRPSIIVTCGKTPTNFLVPDTKPKRYKGKNQEDKEGFGSWRGSLLTSPFFNWPHYIIPMYHPAFVLRNYAEREICILILSRAREEYLYHSQNRILKPLSTYSITTQPSFEFAENFLLRCINSPNPTSVDIELLKRKVPYTISFAVSPSEAISLSFWNYPFPHLTRLWRLMDEIFRTKIQIGQNYTTFDAHWLRCLGFTVNISLVQDTLVRHHVLWPGLRHKLEFQTMQYTRQPYYKEEGKTWSLKDGLDKLMRYNCLDTLVTYEIYNEQELEFAERAIAV
jgi:uracil-DNA glycosylase family 4